MLLILNLFPSPGVKDLAREHFFVKETTDIGNRLIFQNLYLSDEPHNNGKCAE
jgi:hypothetical protein